MLTLEVMARNTAMEQPGPQLPHPDRSIVLIGLMGAGKTSIGRRLAARFGLPFRDADAEIEAAAGCSIAEIFARYGESAFRDGERRVIARLLAGPPMVLATGGGAWMDAETRAAVRDAGARSVWLKCRLPTLLRRVAGRRERPLLNEADPAEVLGRLMAVRHPVYAEADVIVDCGDESPEHTTTRVAQAIAAHAPPRRLHVPLGPRGYDILIGDGLIARAGAHMAAVLPQKRAVVITDANVAPLHLAPLIAALAEVGIEAREIIVKAGEGAKSFPVLEDVLDRMIAGGLERRTAVVALGGGVVGDLAGFAAASALRGLPFVQIPTTLLSQVDSSVGGKTGINTARGKNLVGAFHQPRLVLADAAALRTLPRRQLAAGWAEIAKAGLISDADLFAWCEANGPAAMQGDGEVLAEAVARACAFKAAVVGDDEREERADGGRALLNLGHTFGHALEAETGYGDALLHGEAVAIGMGLAFALSARLGHCDPADTARVRAHLANVGLPATLAETNRRFSAERLVAHMAKDKKVRDGKLIFILARGIGGAFLAGDVARETVLDLLRQEGCDA